MACPFTLLLHFHWKAAEVARAFVDFAAPMGEELTKEKRLKALQSGTLSMLNICTFERIIVSESTVLNLIFVRIIPRLIHS